MSKSPSSDAEAKVECATCQRCKPSCPSQVDLPEVMRLRRYLERPKGSHRDAFILTQKMLARSEAAPWLSPELDTGRDDIHYFPGCLPIMDELIEGFTNFKRAAVAGVALMNHLGVSPRIVYGCCGHDLYYSGNLEHFELIHKRLASIEGRVVTGCAECFHSLKALHGLDAVHISTFLEERLEDVPPEGSGRKATFHDPCRLGRHHGIYDPPRKVLAHVGELREMADSREGALCCGVSAWMNCNPASKKARVKRLVQASEAGAEVLVTACSKCRTHLSCVYREESYSGHPPELEIMDLQEYVADALGLKVPECSIAASRGRRLSPVTERAELQGMLTEEDVDNVFACTTCGRCEVECEYSYEAAG
ncbi:MAG: (Fe-S)-binding protein, partial [Methanomassiliicoccales archaeon]|nr:(Fe-S)-binding protein [Methanomassiliicoccales archaeon]